MDEQLNLLLSPSPVCSLYPRLVLISGSHTHTPSSSLPRAWLWLLPLQAVLVQQAGREAAFRPRLSHRSQLPVLAEGTEPLTVTSGWWCPNSVRDSASSPPPPRPRPARCLLSGAPARNAPESLLVPSPVCPGIPWSPRTARPRGTALLSCC